MLSRFLSYAPDFHALESVMRMHAVKRWHMIDTTRQQTLAEHSCNVAMLAMLIARTGPPFFRSCADAAIWGLIHDLPESFTGDLPGHTKKFLSGLGEVERVVTPPAFRYFDIDPATKDMVKLCDLADGIRFIRLHGIDMTARHAQGQIEDQFKDKLEALKVIWPEDIIAHVTNILTFYAYEAFRTEI